jgi:hypothetical protein
MSLHMLNPLITLSQQCGLYCTTVTGRDASSQFTFDLSTKMFYNEDITITVAYTADSVSSFFQAIFSSPLSTQFNTYKTHVISSSSSQSVPLPLYLGSFSIKKAPDVGIRCFASSSPSTPQMSVDEAIVKPVGGSSGAILLALFCGTIFGVCVGSLWVKYFYKLAERQVTKRLALVMDQFKNPDDTVAADLHASTHNKRGSGEGAAGPKSKQKESDRAAAGLVKLGAVSTGAATARERRNSRGESVALTAVMVTSPLKSRQRTPAAATKKGRSKQAHFKDSTDGSDSDQF